MHARRRRLSRVRSRWLVAPLLLAAVLLVPLLFGADEPGVDTPVALPPLSASDSARRFAVYVADYGYHTAIIVQVPPSLRTVGRTGQQTTNEYVEYAWGDRRFFMESRYAPWSVLATLFWPTEGVMFVATHQRAPDMQRGWRDLQRREVSGARMASLVAQLERWIVRDTLGGRRAGYPPVPSYAGVFYPAHGRYSWWYNCNRWTVAQLAFVDLARPRSTVYWPSQVMSRLVAFERVRR